MAGQSTGPLGPGGSQVLTLPATWATYTASYTCSAPSDTAANAWLEGSADGGTTWFALTAWQSAAPSASPTGTGVLLYTQQAVNALQVHVQCSSGNTVTVTVTGQ